MGSCPTSKQTTHPRHHFGVRAQKQDCGIKGFIPTSVIQGHILFVYMGGESLGGQLLYRRSGQPKEPSLVVSQRISCQPRALPKAPPGSHARTWSKPPTAWRRLALGPRNLPCPRPSASWGARPLAHVFCGEDSLESQRFSRICEKESVPLVFWPWVLGAWVAEEPHKPSPQDEGNCLQEG